MKIKTTELIGPALDWAVAKCEGFKPHAGASLVIMGDYSPSTKWVQGMPVLDRAGICVRAIRKPGHALDGTYMAMEARRLGTGTSPQWAKVNWLEAKPGSDNPPRTRWDGPTHLVAGLRCFVGITLGDEVDVPEELLS